MTRWCLPCPTWSLLAPRLLCPHTSSRSCALGHGSLPIPGWTRAVPSAPLGLAWGPSPWPEPNCKASYLSTLLSLSAFRACGAGGTLEQERGHVASLARRSQSRELRVQHRPHAGGGQGAWATPGRPARTPALGAPAPGRASCSLCDSAQLKSCARLVNHTARLSSTLVRCARWQRAGARCPETHGCPSIL